MQVTYMIFLHLSSKHAVIKNSIYFRADILHITVTDL